MCDDHRKATMSRLQLLNEFWKNKSNETNEHTENNIA